MIICHIVLGELSGILSLFFLQHVSDEGFLR